MTAPATLVSAAGAAPWEAALVGGLLARHSGVQVLARCFDVPQVLAAVSRVRPDVVLVGHDLESLDREVVATLARHVTAVVGAYPAGDPSAVRRLIDIGCVRAVPHDLDPLDLAGLVRDLAGRPPGVADPDPPPPGRLAAVWGPTGAPGRTTVAVEVAAALAAEESPVLLIDGDTYGASVAQALGLSEHPSLITALHEAAVGAFGPDELLPHCAHAGGGLRVLAGPSRADLWPEVRQASLEAVIDAARRGFDLTVADVGFCLEEDEELSFNGAPLRRNLAARVLLTQADLVVGVCRADPVGVRRYLDALPAVADVSGGPLVTVVNRSPGFVPGRQKMELSLALERHTGMPPLGFVPHDPAVEQSLWEGRPVGRARPRTPAARALASVAGSVLGAFASWKAAS